MEAVENEKKKQWQLLTEKALNDGQKEEDPYFQKKEKE